ncbi:MAG: hypothetical protein JSW34_06440, partial [Candidatus Zixiibacteriota bacterium]
MKKVILVFILLLGLPPAGHSDDLYKVTLHRQADADLLNSIGVEPLVWVGGGYLVLADASASQRIRQSALDAELVGSGITAGELAMDGRLDRKNTKRFEVVYEEDNVRLLRVGAGGLGLDQAGQGLFPIINEHLKIVYRPAKPPLEYDFLPSEDIGDLVDSINIDSLYSYVSALQAFPDRVAGSPSNRDARDWIADKFTEFGYDSVVVDPLEANFQTYYNVVAYKPGGLYPEQEIVIGGNFDAFPNSPGADENGSGTAGVLEIAR